MKKFSFLQLFVLAINFFFLFSCQQPAANVDNPPVYDVLPDTVVELKKSEDVLYTYRTDNNSFIDYVEEFDENGNLMSYAQYDYSENPEILTTQTGIVNVIIKDRTPEGKMEISSYGKFKLASNYLIYQMSETKDGTPDYVYYEKYSDDGKYTTEICEFDPSDGGKISYYEKIDYSTKGQGNFQTEPCSDEIFYTGNLTAELSFSTGVLTVSGDKKIKSAIYSSFSANKINRSFLVDNRYDETGTLLQTVDNIEEYYWKPGDNETYWFTKLCDYDSNDGINVYNSISLGDESMSCRIEIKNANANGRTIVTSYYTPDGWIQHQQRIIEEKAILSGYEYYNYTTTEVDADKKIHERFTAKYYEDTAYYFDEESQSQKSRKVLKCNEITEVSLTEYASGSDSHYESNDFSKNARAAKRIKFR